MLRGALLAHAYGLFATIRHLVATWFCTHTHDALLGVENRVSRMHSSLITLMARIARLCGDRYVRESHLQSLYCSSGYLLKFAETLIHVWTMTARAFLPVIAMACLPMTLGMDDDASGSSSRPPMFDGNRMTFTTWFMTFSAWVAWKLTDSATILDGTEPLPVATDPAAPTDEERAAIKDWNKRNMKLYGALAQAVPDYLRTSLFTTHRNHGLDAIEWMRRHYDSSDANDHVVQIARISAHYIDPKAEMSEDNLRLQYDSMMVAKAAIIRIGKAPPDDDSLKAMFDNSLPIAYQATRQ